MMNTELIMTFACSVSYLTELLLLALLLGTNVFVKDGPITPFRRFCALAMFLDAAAILVSYPMVWDGFVSNYEGGLINAMDGLILWAILTAGVQLISNVRNPRRLCLLLGLPYLCIMAYHLCFAGEGLFQGQVAVLVVGCIEILYLNFRFLRHDIDLKQQKSNLDNITASWFGIFTLMVLVELLFWFVVHFSNDAISWVRVVYYLFLQCCYLVLSYFAIRQETTTLADLEEVPSAADDEQSMPCATSLAEQLEQLMQQSKLFRDPDLTLERLTTALHSNNTYVYQCIHDDLGTTFYDYINGLRVEESKLLLSADDDSIEGIALKCGYNSSRSFQRAFKRITGFTPTQWRKNNM